MALDTINFSESHKVVVTPRYRWGMTRVLWSTSQALDSDDGSNTLTLNWPAVARPFIVMAVTVRLTTIATIPTLADRCGSVKAVNSRGTSFAMSAPISAPMRMETDTTLCFDWIWPMRRMLIIPTAHKVEFLFPQLDANAAPTGDYSVQVDVLETAK